MRSISAISLEANEYFIFNVSSRLTALSGFFFASLNMPCAIISLDVSLSVRFGFLVCLYGFLCICIHFLASTFDSVLRRRDKYVARPISLFCIDKRNLFHTNSFVTKPLLYNISNGWSHCEGNDFPVSQIARMSSNKNSFLFNFILA